MTQITYTERRGEIENYFDRTAVQAWARLTSDAPVGRIRASVRAGRDRMRETLLSWLPEDMTGVRLMDAGCGTGALAVEAALRGADVLAIDLSPTLVDLARARLPAHLASGQGAGRIDFRSGDMLDPALGEFDFVVGMDSLIHYESPDAVRVLTGLCLRTRHAVLFTHAPSNPMLATMHAVGKLFPQGNRAPSIVPVASSTLQRLIAEEPQMKGWMPGRSERVSSGFYKSQATELVRA